MTAQVPPSEPTQRERAGKAIVVGSLVVISAAVLVSVFCPRLRKPVAAVVIASPIPPFPASHDIPAGAGWN